MTHRYALLGAMGGASTGLALGLVLFARAGFSAEAATARIDNFTFEPERLVIAPGTTLTWTNRDDIPHTVVATDKSFRSKVLDTDDSYSFTFTSPGTYDYFCSLHPHMKATIVVEAAPKG